MDTERIPFQLDIYDILGYIVPGLVVLWAIQLFSSDIMKVPIPLIESRDIAGVLVALVAAYVLGHIVQCIAGTRTIFYPRGKYPSEYFLEASNKHYSEAFKTSVQEATKEVFPMCGKPRESFDLAYTLVIQKSLNAQTRLFNAHLAFCRALTLAAAVLSLVLILRGCANSELQLASFLFGAVALTTTVVSYFRARYYGERFADSVFRGFCLYIMESRSFSTKEMKQ